MCYMNKFSFYFIHHPAFRQNSNFELRRMAKSDSFCRVCKLSLTQPQCSQIESHQTYNLCSINLNQLFWKKKLFSCLERIYHLVNVLKLSNAASTLTECHCKNASIRDWTFTYLGSLGILTNSRMVSTRGQCYKIKWQFTTVPTFFYC